jgi:hypothetical protein
MKQQILTATITIMTILLVSTLFIDAGNASTQAIYTIQSSGTIFRAANNQESIEVIVRHLGNPMPNWRSNISAEVTEWVATQPWVKGGAVIIDVEDVAPILWYNQDGYNGYIFNNTYGTWSACGWTFSEIETLIDSFHANNVRVVLGITAICKDSINSAWSSNVYQWIANEHPELAFTHPNGELYLSAEGGHSAPLNWFANFTSDDSVSGAIKGESVVQLFDTRLTEMINAGLEWDGIFGSEGFGSVGVWGGPNASNATFIDATAQSMNKWASWTSIMLPNEWSNMDTDEHIQWVMKNASMNYQEFAGYMFASNLFAPIHDTIQAVRQSSGFFVGLIFSPDETWQDTKRSALWGGWSPEVGYNATFLAEYCGGSSYIYYVDTEGTDWSRSMAQAQAYTASSVKSSNLNFNVVIGLHTLNNNGQIAPMSWLYKEYLAEACSYVWVGGQRYATTNPRMIVIQYPDNSSEKGYFRSDLDEFFEWAGNIQSVLSISSPSYLGATYVFSSTRQTYGDMAWSSLNYTVLQWTEFNELSNKPQNLNWTMNTLYLPQVSIRSMGSLANIQDQLLYALANGSLSIIVNSETNYMDAGILKEGLFSGSSTSNSLSTFHVSTPSVWKADNSTEILTQTDNNAKWIVGAYTGNKYTIPLNKWCSSAQAFNLRGHYAANDFIEISKFSSSGLIQLGIYHNSSSGNFLYGQDFSMLPADMVNRGIYWTTNSPVICDNSLIESVVYISSKGGIAIPMWNMQDDSQLLTSININATEIGLSDVSHYVFSWASNPAATWTETSWSGISATINNGADTLIVSLAKSPQ